MIVAVSLVLVVVVALCMGFLAGFWVAFMACGAIRRAQSAPSQDPADPALYWKGEAE